MSWIRVKQTPQNTGICTQCNPCPLRDFVAFDAQSNFAATRQDGFAIFLQSGDLPCPLQWPQVLLTVIKLRLGEMQETSSEENDHAMNHDRTSNGYMSLEFLSS
jgi:hypothetical protein